MEVPSRIFARFCAAFRYASQDTWGLVGQLESQFGLPRKTISQDCERIREALQPHRPGPKPDPTGPLRACLERLEAENTALKTEVHTLHERLSRCVEITPRRIEDVVLTAVTTPPSYAGVGEWISAAFGSAYRPSPGKVSQIVRHWGTKAGLILTDPRVTDRFDEACCDELFAGRRPILTVVEPASLAIGAVELSDHRQGEDWQAVLERFGNLRYVSSDLGTGLRAGIRLCLQIVRHHPDLWHLVVRPLSRITRSLEAQLERAWEAERQALAQSQRPKGQGKLYAPTLARIRQQVAAQFDRMELYYQGLEQLFTALDPIVDEPGAPHLRSRKEAEALLAEALGKLRGLEEPRLAPLLKALEAHREALFTFLDQLHAQVAAVPFEGVDDPQTAEVLRSLVLQEILLSRQRERSNDPQVVAAFQQVWQQIVRLGALQRYYPAWRQALAACLNRPRRTSSLVEAIHSPLRTLQQVHRKLSQPLVDLYALRQNLKPFGNGCRRRGQSPYQRLGVDLGSDDWLEVLRSYRVAS